MNKETYDFESYIELCKPVNDLVVVNVHKERTICVEHTDPENVINVVRMLSADHFENITYIQAMKKAVGLR